MNTFSPIVSAIFLSLLALVTPLAAQELPMHTSAISKAKAEVKKIKGRKKLPTVLKTKGLKAFISAATTGTETIDPDSFIKSFVPRSGLFMDYNKTTGIFTSHAGPGYYEIIFGAHWTRFSRLVVSVDGAQINPFGNLNAQNDWATEAIIVYSNALNPTFAIGATLDPLKLDAGTDEQGCITAFVTIKKL